MSEFVGVVASVIVGAVVSVVVGNVVSKPIVLKSDLGEVLLDSVVSKVEVLGIDEVDVVCRRVMITIGTITIVTTMAANNVVQRHIPNGPNDILHSLNH